MSNIINSEINIRVVEMELISSSHIMSNMVNRYNQTEHQFGLVYHGNPSDCDYTDTPVKSLYLGSLEGIIGNYCHYWLSIKRGCPLVAITTDNKTKNNCYRSTCAAFMFSGDHWSTLQMERTEHIEQLLLLIA